ncbi:MAG: LysR substrate-binding domain-containing protein [Peptococcaceae bacterium]|nr:LysR substrate-binding domain-containing protein [Peptococcaceae bacterium]
MDIQKLKYFIALSENLNFSEAAQQLHISQSALSQQIAELEKQVDAQLLNRNKRPFQLTSAGRVLLKEAYTLVAKADDALKKTKMAADGVIGYLKVGFLGGIEENFLPEGIREFEEAYPHIELSLQHYNWGELNKVLTSGEIDVGFTMSYGFERFPELVGLNLYSDVFSVAMHRNHRLASESMINVAQLANERFATFYRQTDDLLHDYTISICAAHGFIPNITSQFWDLAAILFMVESGLAVTIVPGTVREVASRGVRIIDLEGPNTDLDVMVAWNKNTLNTSIPVFVRKLESLDALKKLRSRTEALKHKVNGSP